MTILLFVISLLASVAGAICGIGGGVIIKPVLDLFHFASVATISFLSGCTVLSMSCYSVCKSIFVKESTVDFKVATPLAVGAAVGGVLGKSIFTAVKLMFENQNTVGAVQGICLAAITAGTLVYLRKKDNIPTKKVTCLLGCIVIGLVLGILSSFLGIGGGPINLVVLYYFFSMETKTAAQNSLYIILFSQITSLATTVLTRSVPAFNGLWLLCMVSGGILGGILGRKGNQRLTAKQVDRLFVGLILVIIGISIYNIIRFAIL